MGRVAEFMRANDFGEILRANLALHRVEAASYDAIHHDIFNPVESRRIDARLRRAVGLVRGTGRWALDFGAGTGNLTLRLMETGLAVVAFDLSRDMLTVLTRRIQPRLTNAVVGLALPFKDQSFSFIGIYSVLHHLPDYASALTSLAGVLRKGGVLYIDHENDVSSPNFSRRTDFELYKRTSHLLNAVYRKLHSISVPSLDYSLADYHCTPEDHIDWQLIHETLTAAGLEVVESRPYLLHSSAFPNPLFPFMGLWRTDMRYLVAVRR